MSPSCTPTLTTARSFIAVCMARGSCCGSGAGSAASAVDTKQMETNEKRNDACMADGMEAGTRHRYSLSGVRAARFSEGFAVQPSLLSVDEGLALPPPF